MKKKIAVKTKPSIKKKEDSKEAAKLELVLGKDLPDSDHELGVWFADAFADQLLYFAKGKVYYEYLSDVWAEIPEEVVRKRIVEKIEAQMNIAEKNRDTDTVGWCKQHLAEKHLSRIIKAGRRRIMVEDRRSNASKIEFDKQSDLLNVLNGTVDLATGKLEAHRADHFFRKVVPVAFKPDAKSKVVSDLITTITGGNVEKTKFLQKLVGYFLFGTNNEQVFAFFHGKTGTGKSTFVEALVSMLGELGWNADVATFMKPKFEANGSSPKPDLAQMDGCRLVSASEASSDWRLNDGKMKELTGERLIRARKLHQNLVKVDCGFKIVITTNYLPQMSINDDAVWRRVIVYPFDNQVPQNKQDKLLREKLSTPEARQALLAWAVKGAAAYKREGLFPLPTFVLNSVTKHRESMNSVASFVKVRCSKVDGAVTPGDELLKAYQLYCRQVGVEPVSRIEFYRTMTEMGFTPKHTNKSTGRVGISLIDTTSHSSAAGRQIDKKLSSSPAGKSPTRSATEKLVPKSSTKRGVKTKKSAGRVSVAAR